MDSASDPVAVAALERAAAGLSLHRMRQALATGALPTDRAYRNVFNTAGVFKGGGDGRDEARVQALRLLLRYDSNMTVQRASELLFDAAYCCSAPVVRVLLDTGAEPRFAKRKGMTALHGAYRADVIQLLVAAGADIEARNVRGQRPLHSSAMMHARPKVPLVKALLNAGAEVNAQTDAGYTPLYLAAYNVTAEIGDVATVLLDAGADPSIRGEEDESVLDAAISGINTFTAFLHHDRRSFDALVDRMQLFSVVRPATAWWRRRHLLLAIRDRHDGQAAAAVATAGDGSSGAAAAGTNSGEGHQ